MKVSIVAVGRLKEKYFAEAVAEYAKRLGAYCEFKVVEVPAAPPAKSPAEQSEEEGRALLSKARGFVVAMDGGGKEVSSKGLAQTFAAECGRGQSEFCFVIGGSHGLSREVLERADAVLSFGKPTYPHQLFRVMLAEQIYRAFTINAGTPYHK